MSRVSFNFLTAPIKLKRSKVEEEFEIGKSLTVRVQKSMWVGQKVEKSSRVHDFKSRHGFKSGKNFKSSRVDIGLGVKKSSRVKKSLRVQAWKRVQEFSSQYEFKSLRVGVDSRV